MNNFSKQANFYALYRPSYPKELYDFIFRHLKNKRKAWDCGTGSGQLASYLADHFEEVFATDISKEQLRFAHQKNNIKYINAPVETSGLPSNIFDLVTVAQAIHWFDFGKFYEEVNRTTRKDALLAVIGYGMIRTDPKIDDILDRFYNYVFGKYFNENRKYIDEQYETIPFPFEEISSPSFEIKLQWSLKELEGFFNSWSTVQKFKIDEGFNPADDVLKEIRPLWGANKTRTVKFSIFLRLGKTES